MPTPDLSHRLTRLPLLADLTPAELYDLTSIHVEQSYPAVTLIFEEGSLDDAFYIITSGKVEITKHVRGHGQVVIGEISDFFGEMALLERRPRSATVRALEPTLTLKMAQQDLHSLLFKSPRAYHQIARALSSRLREMNEHLILFLQAKHAELQGAYTLLKQTQSLLVAKEQLAALGMAVSHIIHDIKHPVSAVMGYADLICTQSPENTNYTDAIIREAQRLTDMIQEVLDFAQGKEAEVSFGRHRVESFLDELHSFVEPQIRNRPITLETDVGHEGHAVFDINKLRRVFHNLLSNAIEALPAQGGTVRLHAHAEGTMLVVVVSDSGPGIAVENSARLFEPFATYGKRRGTGLGLAICKNIVEAHHGTIAVEHQPSTGTSFVVRLPDCVVP